MRVRVQHEINLTLSEMSVSNEHWRFTNTAGEELQAWKVRYLVGHTSAWVTGHLVTKAGRVSLVTNRTEAIMLTDLPVHILIALLRSK